MKKIICISLGIILLNGTTVEGMKITLKQYSPSSARTSILKRPSQGMRLESPFKRMRLEPKHVDFKIPEEKRAISDIDEFLMDNGKCKQGEMLTVMQFLKVNGYDTALKICCGFIRGFIRGVSSKDDKLFIRIFLNAHFSEYQQFRTDLLGNVDKFLSSSETNTRTQFIYYLENRMPLIKNKFEKRAADQVVANLKSTILSEDEKLELAVRAWNFWDNFLDELKRQPVVDEKQLQQTRAWRWFDYISPVAWIKWMVGY